jgi:hypothetical protein
MTPPHTHVWVHVNHNGRIVCRCTCGRTLTRSQILSMQEANR